MRQATTLPMTLASASPRRRELLGTLGVPHQIHVSDAEERDDPIPDAVRAGVPVLALADQDHPTVRAWRKLDDIRQRIGDGLILAADTIVVLDGDVLNKPRDPADARQMLGRLAGRWHIVYTGVAVARGAALWLDCVASRVRIAPLDTAAITAYVATGEPLDKAGGYGIQGLGGALVQQIDGSFTNVVGLPLCTVWLMLARAGAPPPIDPGDAFRRWRSVPGREAMAHAGGAV
jgi:septum formation protein